MQIAKLCTALGMGLAFAQAASAQEPAASDYTHPTLLPFRSSAHASFDWEGDFGAGLRIDIPIADRNRTYNAHDEFSISLGADVMFITFRGANELFVWPTATVQWSLAVTEQFSFYPELGLVARIKRSGWDGMFPNLGFGGRYYFTRSVALTGRLGWPIALAAGVAF